MSRFEAGLDGVTFTSGGCRLLGGFYKAAGETPRPTAILVHGLPGIEKHLDIAYHLRDVGWNCLYFHFRGCWGSQGAYSLDGLAEDTQAAVEWVLDQPATDKERIALLGASTGSHPAFLCAAADPRIRAMVGISPLIEPRAFQFPTASDRGFDDGLTVGALRRVMPLGEVRTSAPRSHPQSRRVPPVARCPRPWRAPAQSHAGPTRSAFQPR